MKSHRTVTNPRLKKPVLFWYTKIPAACVRAAESARRFFGHTKRQAVERMVAMYEDEAADAGNERAK